MNKQQAKKQLRAILAKYDWKNAPVINARAVKDAVYFAKENGLELPPEIGGLLIAKVFSRMYEREQVQA
jgi:hypothetical protein